MTERALSRRIFLTGTAAVGAFSCAAGFSPPALASDGHLSLDRLRKEDELVRNRQGDVMTGVLSSNGWEMEKITDGLGNIHTRPVPGTPLDGIQVRLGTVEVILVHLVRRFHYEITPVKRGEIDAWQHPETVRTDRPESNLASGTAVRIQPDHYPAGSRDNFFPLQSAVIRDILAELDGVVRWGGDDPHSDEALFYIDVLPEDPRLASLDTRIRSWLDQPGKGAGAPPDVASPARRKAASALERQQKNAA
jgi:hypothetical protein